MSDAPHLIYGEPSIRINNSAKLLRTLTLAQVIMIGLAYIQPMTVFDTFGSASNLSGAHVPTAYIFATVAILFTALSYGKLVKKYPSAGTAYTYAQQSMSPHIGFMVGWSSMLDYLLMPLINIILARSYLESIFPGISPWIYVVVLVAFMTFINLRGINFVANFNTVIVILQFAAIFIFLGFLVHGIISSQGAQSLIDFKPFYTENASTPAIITAATILCFSFLGFDGLSSLSEETLDADRVIPKAIFMTALIAGILFIVVSYLMQVHFPQTPFLDNYCPVPMSSDSLPVECADEESTLPLVMNLVLGAAFKTFILLFSSFTVLASGVAAHAGVSRLMYVMGRDGVLPKTFFGFISPKFKTPIPNVILVGAVALLAIWLKLEWIIDLLSFGALIAFTFVNLSVIAQFFIREGKRNTIKEYVIFLIFPILGTASVSTLWFSLQSHAMEAGLIWASLGFLYMLFITRFFTKKLPVFHEDPSK